MAMKYSACMNLVDAICKQASKDYRRSKGKDLNAREFFLRDRIFQTLNVDGELILEKLDAEIEAKKKKEAAKKKGQPMIELQAITSQTTPRRA